MPCEEWTGLLECYRTAVDAYNEATKALNAPPGAAFNATWQQAERARAKSNGCRADLMHHEHSHGCLGVPQPSASKRASGKKDGELRLNGSVTAA
jgi:hypothetical protein